MSLRVVQFPDTPQITTAGRPVPSILEIVVITPRRHRRRTLQELRRVIARFARRRALGRIAGDLGLQFHQIGEGVSLAARLVGDHWGWLEIVETTVTRTARRCTASTSERKSPSPENSTI